jgi:hypothetical protein
MRRDIDMKQSAARMLNDHQHIENAKRRRDRHAEVTRHDAFGRVADECRPVLRWGAVAWVSYTIVRHILAHRSRRDLYKSSLSNSSLAMRSCPQVGFSVCFRQARVGRVLDLDFPFDV